MNFLYAFPCFFLQANHSTLPYSAVYAILHTCQTVGTPPNQWREDFSNKLTNCCLAVLTNTVARSHTSRDDDSSWEGALWDAAVSLVSQRQDLWGQICEESNRRVQGELDS